jgi:hypothetical protein
LEIINEIIINRITYNYDPIIITLSDRVDSYGGVSIPNSISINELNKLITKLQSPEAAHLAKDGMMIFPSKLFKNFRFPEVDFYVPEYSIIRHFRDYPALFVNIKLKFLS